MEGIFSSELIERVKAYYARRGVILNDDQAHEYLLELADLYEGFMRMCAGRGGAAPAASAAETPAPDLITPHSCND